MKRMVIVAVMVSLLLSALCIDAYAATNEASYYSYAVQSRSELASRFQEIKNRYVGTYWTTNGSPNSNYTASKYYYGWQCKGFGNYVFNELFKTGNIGAYNESYKYYINSPNCATLISQATNVGASDTATVKAFLSGALMGDMIQVKRRNSSNGHTMIVESVSDAGVTIFDCNADGKCGVQSYVQSWATFASKNISMSLYRSTVYPPEEPCYCSDSYAGNYICTTSSLPLMIRSGHGASYGVIGSIPPGTTVYVSKANGAWAHVEYNGISGFASMEYLQIIGNPEWVTISANKTNIDIGETVQFGINSNVSQGYNGSYFDMYVWDSAAYAQGLAGTWFGVSGTEAFYTFNTPGDYYVRGRVHNSVSDIYSEPLIIHVTGTYTISYDANGGTGAPASQVKKYNEDITLRSEVPTRSGYSFLGWTWDANATNFAFWPGSPYKDNADLTLYAYWVKDGTEMSVGADRSILNGDYTIIISQERNSALSLDIEGTASPARDGTNVCLSAIEGQDFTVWTLTYLENGFYSIIQKGTNMALTVENDSPKHTANLQVNAYTGSLGQQWCIESAIANGVSSGLRLRSRASGLAVDIAHGTIESGTNIWMWAGNSTASQSWVFISYKPEYTLADGRYILLSNQDIGFEVDIPGNGYIADVENVQIWNYKTPNDFDQALNAFDVISVGDGYYKLINTASQKALTVQEDSTVFNMNVVVADYTGATGQQWAIVRDDNAYVLLARCSGYALEVQNADMQNGANVDQYRYVGTANKQWQLVPSEYEIRYNDNGGTGGPKSQMKYYKSTTRLYDIVPTLAGKVFEGWSVSPNAKVADYQPGDNYTADADITLYAVWAGPDFILPAGLTEIDEEAFAGAAFSFVSVPEATAQIKARAFANCPNLKYILIPNDETVIAKDAFEGVANLTIFGRDGSYAQYFANKYGYTFIQY